jgi:hypothetical protein
VFGILVIGIQARLKGWLNIGLKAFETSGKESEVHMCVVEYEQALRSKIFQSLGRFDGYFAK